MYYFAMLFGPMLPVRSAPGKFRAGFFSPVKNSEAVV